VTYISTLSYSAAVRACLLYKMGKLNEIISVRIHVDVVDVFGLKAELKDEPSQVRDSLS